MTLKLEDIKPWRNTSIFPSSIEESADREIAELRAYIAQQEKRGTLGNTQKTPSESMKSIWEKRRIKSGD